MGKSTKSIDSAPNEETPLVKLTNRRVTASMGTTINLGDYQSQRVELGLSADIADDIHIEDGFGNVLDYVESQLQYEVERILTDGNVIEKARVDIRSRTGRKPKVR